MKRQISLLFIWGSMAAAASSPLDDYIQTALHQNLSLQQKTFSLQESTAALREARGLFMPSINFESRYSRAGGGRLIEIPVGDLMNPVYSTLNKLSQQMGQPAKFPENIPNVAEPFLREREHDTKLRLVQPIFQAAIFHNYKIRKNLSNVEQTEQDIYKRHLITDVKTAYYNYLKTGQIVRLLDETEALLLENRRVSESLFANDKVTQDVVFRAEAELHALHQQQAAAEKQNRMAQAYFNFLLNQPLDQQIIVDEPEVPASMPSMLLEESERTALHHREELKQLESAGKIMKQRVSLSQSAFLPGVTAVVDYGYQGEKYRFGKSDDYWMASLVANWNLFNGFQDKYRVDQARAQQRQAEAREEEVRQQIQLQVREAFYGVHVSIKSMDAAEARRLSAQKSYKIIDRKFREGMSPQIEFIDARNTLTGAEVDLIIAKYDYFIRLAEYEKVTAAYSLSHDEEAQ